MKKGIHPESYRLVVFRDMSNGIEIVFCDVCDYCVAQNRRSEIIYRSIYFPIYCNCSLIIARFRKVLLRSFLHAKDIKGAWRMIDNFLIRLIIYYYSFCIIIPCLHLLFPASFPLPFR